MVLVRPGDLASMHPSLLWTEIAGALAVVLNEPNRLSPHSFNLAVQDVPGFGTSNLALQFDLTAYSAEHLETLRRTYELSRLVELAAIGIAGIGMHLAGGHEIRDVALRGSGADYLVDHTNHLLEVAGRSNRADFAAAWRERCQRLSKLAHVGYYVCVSEFETPAATLAFLSE
jgi:hypothetical protein